MKPVTPPSTTSAELAPATGAPPVAPPRADGERLSSREDARAPTPGFTARLWLVPAILAAALLAAPAFAHHSNSAYDRDQQIEHHGTVIEFDWTNPHSQLIFEEKDRGGNVQRWVAEGPPPSQLEENGWKKDTLKPGDKVRITGNPSRNGTPTLRLRWVTFANGKDLFAYLN